MTPQQLRDSILQLAMEGKLVEQRLEEGTGEELYQLIQEEKQELIKAGKLKKQKELSEIAEAEIPFEIPTTWKWVKLGNVINYFMGKTPPRAEPEWWGRDIPWVSISDMSDYSFIKMSKELVSTKAINEKFTRISRAGTLLMSFKLTVGRTSILDTDAVHNEAIISILPYVDSSNSFRDYLFYFLPTIVQWGNYKNAIKGKTLNSKSISNLCIPLPPIGEQKRIVEKITKILPMTDRYEKFWLRLNELNKRFPEELQKSILQEAIQGKLFKQKDEDESAKSLIEKILLERAGLIEAGQIKKQKALPPIQEDAVPFDIPDSWCWERLGNISTYNQTKRKVKAIDLKESTWVLDLEDIEKNTGNILERINAKDKKVSGDKLVFYKGQLLYSKLRPYLKKILIAPDDGVCTPELVPFNILGGCNTNYILSVLKSPYVDFFINSVTYGVKMPRVSAETMVNLLIPIPTIKVQNNIAEMIEKVNPLCDKLRILIK